MTIWHYGRHYEPPLARSVGADNALARFAWFTGNREGATAATGKIVPFPGCPKYLLYGAMTGNARACSGCPFHHWIAAGTRMEPLLERKSDVDLPHVAVEQPVMYVE